LLDQYRSNGLYPGTDAPLFFLNDAYQHGGYAVPGDRFTISNPNVSGTLYYTFDGTDPNPGTEVPEVLSSTIIVSEDAPKTVLIPTSTNPATDAWRVDPQFDDSAWRSGSGIVGYENDTGYEDFITIDVHDDMFGVNASAYLRIPFSVSSSDITDMNALTLKMWFDDGFIAYLNGVRVAEVNAPEDPAWDEISLGDTPDFSAARSFDVTDYLSELRVGSNLLAIHGLNASGGDSSDFIIAAELLAEQIVIPEIGGGGENIFTATGLLSPEITLEQTVTVKARVFDANEWSALNQATYVVGSLRQDLRITEIMYHPELTEELEFIELQNIGTTPLNLTGVQLTNGINFTFPNITLAPNEYSVVVRNQTAFANKYGPDMPTVGQYTGRLDNNGERITLQDALGEAILDFSYADDWYPATDGDGYALTIIDAHDGDPASWNDKARWERGSTLGGTPAAAPPTKRVND
jgi:hypothetical protein